MSTQRLAPDAVLLSTNYTTLNLTDIQDDPDSPDANYGTWDGNGNTDARVSFPTPTGNPTVGAGLQEFRALIRRNGATTNTGWALELWENGALVSSLATGTLTNTTPIVVSGTWNASLLGTADGSLVECRVDQTSGGTGGTRSGVEVGAIEWNAVYTANASGYGQANAYIKTVAIKGFGQAQTDIKAVGQAFSQAQAYISGTTSNVSVTFGSTVSNGWPNADTGEVFNTAYANDVTAFSSNGSVGQVIFGGTKPFTNAISFSQKLFVDVEINYDFSITNLPILTNTDTYDTWIRGTIDSAIPNNFINPFLRVHADGTVDIEVDWYDSGASSDQSNYLLNYAVISTGTVYRVKYKFITVGTNILWYAKLYDPTGAEPEWSNIGYFSGFADNLLYLGSGFEFSWIMSNHANTVSYDNILIKGAIVGSSGQAQADVKTTQQVYGQAQATIFQPTFTRNAFAQAQALIGRVDNLYSYIDEVTPDDSDYILAKVGTSLVRMQLSPLVTPDWPINHILRIRYSGPGFQWTLYSGTTLVAQHILPDSIGSYTTYEYSLDPSTEISLIGNYNDLEIEFISGISDTPTVSWVELEVPSGSAAATRRGFAQTKADIKAITKVFAQAQANIKATNYTFAQAQTDIKITSTVFAQAQANIKVTVNIFGQANADIKATSLVYAQAQSDIKVTSQAYAQAQANIKYSYQVFANVQADIKTSYQVFAQAQSDIKTKYQAYSQAQAAIKQAYQSYANALGIIRITTTNVAQAQADIKQAYQIYAQAQANIKTTYINFAQAQSDIRASYTVFAQAQAYIKVTGIKAFAQANADIKQIYQVYAQANARIISFNVQAYAQAQGNVRFNGNAASAQAQAKINAFGYPQWAQALGSIKSVYKASGQAQADILASYTTFANSQADIKQIYSVFAQAQVDIKQRYQVYAQALALIVRSNITTANAQADIKHTYYGFAQSTADIKATAQSYGQAQAQIGALSAVYGQAQADIKTRYTVYAQAIADIKSINNGFGQALADIVVATRTFAQAQAIIIKSYQAYGQVNASLKATSNACGNAQGTIKRTYAVFAQAQGSIKIIEQAYAQAQTYIIITNRAYAQTQAIIRITVNKFAQAQGTVEQTYTKSAQAQGYIKTGQQAQAQAQAIIKVTSTVFAQAQTYIISGHFGFAQSAAQILLVGIINIGQAQAFIIKACAFAQAAAAILQLHRLTHLLISDRIQISLLISDRETLFLEADRVTIQLGIRDTIRLGLEISDQESLALDITDINY